MPNKHEGLPDDWRYCYHAHRVCAYCEQADFNGSRMVERRVKFWKDAEHYHITCALEKAVWMIEKYSKAEPPKRLINFKWKPKEPK